MLAQMFSQAKLDAMERTPGGSRRLADFKPGSRSTQSLDETTVGTGEDWTFTSPIRRALHREFQTLEPVIGQEPLTTSVASSQSGSPPSEKKALLAYSQCLESRLRAMTGENRGLRLQLQEEEARFAQLHSSIKKDTEFELRLRAKTKQLNMRMKARDRVGVLFDAWSRVTSRAWRDRCITAEHELAALRSGGLDLRDRQRAEEAERAVLEMKAALRRQHQVFTQERSEAQGVQRQSAALQASSEQVSKQVQVLSDRLAHTEALLAEERKRSFQGELQASLADRVQAETAEELRQQLISEQSAKAEAERLHGLAEVELIKLSRKLQLAESDLASSQRREEQAQNGEAEVSAHARVLAEKLRLLEDERDAVDEAARASEALRLSVTQRLQQAASEVDLAKATAEAASMEARHLQEMVMRAKVNQTSSLSEWEGFQTDVRGLLVDGPGPLPPTMPTVQDSEAYAEMAEALDEIKRWRLHGTPPKNGSALQKSLKARIEDVERQLLAARAIRERGQKEGGSVMAGIAAAAVSAARTACSEDRLAELEEDLQSTRDVKAAAEALMSEIAAHAGKPSDSAGELIEAPDDHADSSHEPRCRQAAADGLQKPGPNPSEEAVRSFTAELLEALAACRMEMELVRPACD